MQSLLPIPKAGGNAGMRVATAVMLRAEGT